MGSNKSSLMLKYQKAKVKLLEYEVPEKEWPSFPLNYRDLAYPTVLAISQYAEAINEDLERTTLIISKKPGNTGKSRDRATEFTTKLLLLE